MDAYSWQQTLTGVIDKLFELEAVYLTFDDKEVQLTPDQGLKIKGFPNDEIKRTAKVLNVRFIETTS